MLYVRPVPLFFGEGRLPLVQAAERGRHYIQIPATECRFEGTWRLKTRSFYTVHPTATTSTEEDRAQAASVLLITNYLRTLPGMPVRQAQGER